MDKHNQGFRVSKERSFKGDEKEFVIQLKHPRHFNWWWLLLLLPLLLFIPCHKDITVTCIDTETKAPLSDQQVTLAYTSHHLWNAGKMLPDSLISLTQKTDSTGTTVFKDLPCSVYSYIFYCLSKAKLSAIGECTAQTDTTCNFHYTRHFVMKMKQKKEDLHVKLLDLEMGYELPDGMVVYKYVVNGKEKTDSAKADAAGIVTIPHMNVCSVMKSLTGRCYGYADTTRLDAPCKSLIVASDSMALRLRPIKKRFTFFVKDKLTRQPIADANCLVTLTPPQGSATTRNVWTSTDGRGIGVYDNAFVKSVISIHASKQGYKDGDLKGGPWTVDQFIKQDDDTRTIWLEPEPLKVDFINLDTLSHLPIAGVKNVIKVIDPSGKDTTFTETSNSNGIFPVAAVKGSRIEIDATLSPQYERKFHVVESFAKPDTVWMTPNLLDLTFRTIEGTTNAVLPDCQLDIMTTISNISEPTNSGNGVFVVEGLRYGEQITIIASKDHYTTNDTKIYDACVDDLLYAPQQRRDIPLEMILEPCNASANGMKGVEAGSITQQSYNMGSKTGEFEITYFTGCACPDCIEIYNHEPGQNPKDGKRILNTGQVKADPAITRSIRFNHGSVITVIVTTGPKDRSEWRYDISCPK